MIGIFNTMSAKTGCRRGINEVMGYFVISSETLTHSQLSEVSKSQRIMYTKNVFFLRTNQREELIFKDIN